MVVGGSTTVLISTLDPCLRQINDVLYVCTKASSVKASGSGLLDPRFHSVRLDTSSTEYQENDRLAVDRHFLVLLPLSRPRASFLLLD